MTAQTLLERLGGVLIVDDVMLLRAEGVWHDVHPSRCVDRRTAVAKSRQRNLGSVAHKPRPAARPVQRRAQAASTGVAGLPIADRLKLLARSTRLVAEVNGGDPQCVDMSAVLARCAQQMNVDVEPRGMALIVQGPDGTCILGEAVHDMVPAGHLRTGEPGPGFDPKSWHGAGHIVLMSPEGPTLFDPTFDQTSLMTGMSVGALVIELPSDAVAERDLMFEWGGGVVMYRHVPTDQTWQAPFAAAFMSAGDDARLIVRRALELEGHPEALMP